MSKDTNSASNKNAIYIAIITGVIVLAAIIFLVTRGGSNSSNSANNGTTTPAPISVVNEEGNQEETLKSKIAVRDIKFGKTIKQIKKSEKKMEDTLDNPSSATSEDGYTYLTYKFNPDAAPSFFGTEVLASANTSMLVYVFYQDSLIEVRIQYGSIGNAAYENIVAYNNNEFGKATYSRSYSNGTKQSWWKTSDKHLDVICQNGDVVAYYRVND